MSLLQCSSPMKDSDLESVHVFKSSILKNSENEEDSDSSGISKYSQPLLDLTCSPELASHKIIQDKSSSSGTESESDDENEYVIDLTNEEAIPKQIQEFQLKHTQKQTILKDSNQQQPTSKFYVSSQTRINDYFNSINVKTVISSSSQNDENLSSTDSESDLKKSNSKEFKNSINVNINVTLNATPTASNGSNIWNTSTNTNKRKRVFDTTTPSSSKAMTSPVVYTPPTIRDMMIPSSSASSRVHLPEQNELGTGYVAPMSQSMIADPQIVNEVKNLIFNAVELENITPKEERLQTPERLRVTLLEHQKLGLEFMLKQENGKSQGG